MSDGELVTRILAGVVIPIEKDAEILRGRQQLESLEQLKTYTLALCCQAYMRFEKQGPSSQTMQFPQHPIVTVPFVLAIFNRIRNIR